MAKIVIDAEIDNKNISNNDILVYDVKKQAFINKKKAVFLGETTKEIDNIRQENKCLKTQINNLETKFNSLLKLLKEKL